MPAFYGHLLVDVSREAGESWQARFEPVYIFPVMSPEGEVQAFESRHYDDVLVLKNDRVH